jgi:sn1-specific diacylglycerol lipase
MPAIHLFQRKTLSGGDDLHLPCLWAIWMRILQLFALLIPIWWHLTTFARDRGGWYNYLLLDPNDDASCRHSHLFPLLLTCYAVASTLIAVVGLALELRLLQVSSRGTPTEPGTRSEKVQALLELKLVPYSACQALIVLLGLTAVAGFASSYTKCLEMSNDTDNPVDFWQSMNDFIKGLYLVHTTTTIWNVTRIPWWWVAYTFLLFFQLVEVIISFSYVRGLLAQPIMTEETTYALEHPHQYHELVEEMWTERCTHFCQCLGMSTCFFFGGREVSLGDYGDISRALADYFETGGVLDLVPSDVAAGFLVLGRIQRKRVLEARHAVVSERQQQLLSPDSLLLPSNESSDLSERSRRATTYLMQQEGSQTFYEVQTRSVLSRHKAVDLTTLAEGARFSRYALAIYTWGLYVYTHPLTGPPRLVCNKLVGCSSCRNRRGDDDEQALLQRDYIHGDNCFETNKSALLLHAKLDEESDLVYAHFKSGFNHIPYCILLDHKWKSVVVAIRGTFSLEDCVTDVLIDPEPLDRVGEEYGFDGTGQHCHGGVLSCARNVYRDLQRHGLLEKMLLGNDAEFPEYNLRIVGHSLGAAASTLLSYMLRERFPTVRCLNFSPPGCALTWKLATDCQEFCTSFVLDSELVPRLSLDSMEHLRDEILGLIGRIKVPKVQVAHEVLRGSGFFSGRLFVDGDLENDGQSIEQCLDRILYEPNEVPEDSEFQQQLNHFRQVQSELKSRRGQARTIQMYPPGKIVHLIKTGEQTSCMHGVANCLSCCMTNFGSEYTPVWVSNDDLNEVVISSTMATDHFPNRMCDELGRVAYEYNIDVEDGDVYSQQQVNVAERV